MSSFHLIYTLDGKFHSELRLFFSLEDAEFWLEQIGASDWEIGFVH